MGNTNTKNSTVVPTEDYEAKIKALEKELKEKDKTLKEQDKVLKEQETTLKEQAEKNEKYNSAPTMEHGTAPAKNYVSEDNYKKYVVKLHLNRQLGDKVVKVNDKEYLIQRGVNVEVPEWVKEALDHEEEMELEDYNHQEQVNAKLSMF